MKKSMTVFLIVITSVITLALSANIFLSVFTLQKVNAAEAAAKEQRKIEEAKEGDPTEDNIMIGGSYMIRSTKHISDAYLSGDTSSLDKKDMETLDMAKEILDQIITDGMSDYDKELAVFRWMNENIGGDADVTVLVRDDVSTDNPHGVLMSRNAVCVGYATTFRLFMQMLDIPCMVVHDVNLIHTWDLVQIGEHWYHVDLYSASGLNQPEQFLNFDDQMKEQMAYGWDTSLYPAADSLEKCYVYEHAETAKDIYAIPGKVYDAINDSKGFVALKISGDEMESALAEYLCSSLESRLMGSVEYQFVSLTHSVTARDGEIFVYIRVEDYSNYSDDVDPDFDEEKYVKIEDAISSAFGELTDLAYDDYYDI